MAFFAGRVVAYKLTCDPAAPAGQGPSRVLEHEPVPMGYLIEWKTSAVCKPVAASCDMLPPAPPVVDPKPSTELLLYQEMEMGALVRQTPFEAIFIPKTMALPRQARDKHREKLRKCGVFAGLLQHGHG